MIQISQQDICTSHHVIDDIEVVGQVWQDLYARSDEKSVFLHWQWIKQWLTSLPMSAIIVKADCNGKCLGLAIFVVKRTWVFPGWPIKQLWLHRVGDDKYDQIWIEQNDFLLDSDYANIVRQQMIEYVAHKLSWHECFIGLTGEDIMAKFKDLSVHRRSILSSPDYVTELSKFKNGTDYLGSLSKNTRQQIQRSIKLLEQEGNLSLQEPQSQEDKQQYFEEMAEIHIDKWRKSSFGSGFDNNLFKDFHQKLVDQGTEKHFVALWRLSLDQHNLAYIYLLKGKKDWYFYLSAIQTHADNRIKIGLVAHHLIIEQAIKDNIERYHFLAGEARYKHSLSNQSSPEQQLVCFYKHHPLLRYRENLRSLKQYVIHKFNEYKGKDAKVY